VRVAYSEPTRLRAENSVTGLKLSLPAEKPKVVRAAMRIATFGIHGRHPDTSSDGLFSTRGMVIFFVVLAAAFVAIGIELKKS
jgi:hypothetical protein